MHVNACQITRWLCVLGSSAIGTSHIHDIRMLKQASSKALPLYFGTHMNCQILKFISYAVNFLCDMTGLNGEGKGIKLFFHLTFNKASHTKRTEIM